MGTGGISKGDHVFVVRRNRRRLALYSLLSAGFALACWQLSTETLGWQRRLNIISAVLLALVAVLITFQALSGRAVVKVSDAGVLDLSRPWRRQLIPWGHLTAITPWAATSIGDWVTFEVTESSGLAHEVHIHTDAIQGGQAALMDAVTAHPRFPASPAGNPRAQAPTEPGSRLVPDWPTAVARPMETPDPSSAFEAETAPSSAVGVLQWTSGLLVDGGNGPGSWEFIELVGWAVGDMSGVVSGIGGQSSDVKDLEQAVSGTLGHHVSIEPSTWMFTRKGDVTWWTAPLLVILRAD